jgi:GNAT superfamily N-acetyltransferase
MTRLYFGDLKRADAVHRKIPEFDPSYIQEKYLEKDVGRKNPYVIVYEHNGLDVGYMIGYDMPDSMYLWLNGTLPEYRKKGAFRLMLGELSKEAGRRQHTKITVKSYERFAPMLKTLAACGFKQTETKGLSILLEKNL